MPSKPTVGQNPWAGAGAGDNDLNAWLDVAHEADGSLKVVPLADGGTGASLVDPNADRILFWDDSAGAFTFLTPGSGLTITGTTMTASGGGGTSIVLNVKEAPYNATGNGTTDDAAAINSAVNDAEANGGTVWFPPGTYRLSSTISIGTYFVRLQGAGWTAATLKPDAGVTAITFEATTGPLPQNVHISHLRILGTGVRATDGTTGIKTVTTAGIIVEHVFLENLDDGMYLPGIQFSTFRNVNALHCRIAYRLTTVTDGGGNSNLFEACNAQSCEIALMAYQTSTWGFGLNTFLQCNWLTCTMTALYLNGTGDNMRFQECAPEDNGNGASTSGTYYGKTVKRSTGHIVDSKVVFDNQYWISAASKSLILENSHIRYTGSGSFAGPEIDSASTIASPWLNANGVLYSISEWPWFRIGNSVILLGTVLQAPSEIPNLVPTPRTVGLTAQTGTTGSGTDTDATWGRIPYVQFAASAGTAYTTNYATFTGKSGNFGPLGEAFAFSCLIRSSVATQIGISLADSINWDGNPLPLAAGVTYRLVLAGLTVGAGQTGGGVFWPLDTAGPKINMWNGHCITAATPDDPTIKAFVKYGWFNPGPPVVVVTTQADNYTLALSDANTVLELTKATANTVTVPPNSSVAYPVGTVLELHQYGAGQVTVAPGAGVTINSPGGKLKLATRYSTAVLRKRATNEWELAGDIAT